ncbi:MAG: RND family efflux transporter MFP subunit [Planctomycetota bacterium]|jgi:RND family efflux transporter MFP subunit
MQSKRPLLVRAALSLSFASAGATSAFAQQPVFVETVELVPSQETERVIGSLRARSTSVMAALEEGVLLSLDVREADHVAKGEVLAKQDTRRLKATRIQLVADHAMAEATRLERQAQLENAKEDLAAIERAAQKDAISDRDLRNARTSVQTRAALVEAATQALASLDASIALIDIRIADAVVKAPFDGQITARHAEVGQWIRPGEPLVTLVSSGTLEAWLDLPERFAGRFDQAASLIQLRAEASGTDLSGLSPRAIPMVDDRARTFRLVMDVAPEEAAKLSLQPGMSISGVIPLGKATPRLMVAKDAVLRRGTNSLVARIGDDNISQLVPIKVLFTMNSSFAVEPMIPGALEAGHMVVVEGNERLYPGTPVTPMRRDEASPTEGAKQ